MAQFFFTSNVRAFLLSSQPGSFPNVINGIEVNYYLRTGVDSLKTEYLNAITEFMRSGININPNRFTIQVINDLRSGSLEERLQWKNLEAEILSLQDRVINVERGLARERGLFERGGSVRDSIFSFLSAPQPVARRGRGAGRQRANPRAAAAANRAIQNMRAMR